MAIKTRTRTEVALAHGRVIVFSEMALAKEWCQGKGVELGAAAHNPFGLGSRCFNVAPFNDDDPNHPDFNDYTFYCDEQAKMCQEYAVVDRPGTATNIPYDDNELDYVISSHVLEHEPNLIAALIEMTRVVKDGGVIFFIVPKRDALSADRERPITQLNEFIEAYEENHGPDPEKPGVPGNQNGRGHYWVFTLASILELINWCNENLGLGWEIVATEETDSKVRNGHTVVARVNKTNE